VPKPSAHAVVTGFIAAHPLFHRTPQAWIGYSASSAPDLRALFSREPSWNFQEYSAVSHAAWWERFFASGIIGELESCGLWRDGRLDCDPERVGVCFSSSKGRPALLEKTREYSWGFACDWAARAVLKISDARGKTLAPVAACAGGTHAIAVATQWIEDGLCDVVLCGALEAELAPMVLAGYRSLGALSGSGVMRPFDAARDGFVPGSGGALLVLESQEHAQRRNAKIRARVAGWSLGCDATSLTAMEPSGDPIARQMDFALNGASVDYLNAHGTATHLNDEIEARAIGKVLGAQIPISSTKPLTGHLLGAAGAVEAVLSLLAMEQNFVPPNLNLDNVDEACGGVLLPQSGMDKKIERVMSLSYGFGGHIGTLVLEKA
jgi:3-oxoacyl-(acyl-carrier-protein) synthase